MFYVFKSIEGATEFQPSQFQTIKTLKPLFIDIVEQMKNGKKEKEERLSVVCVGVKPINIKITLVAGHWTEFGSVMIRFENFPINYSAKNFDADFSVMLLEPIKENLSIGSEMVYLNGISITTLPNLGAFESWLKDQIISIWN